MKKILLILYILIFVAISYYAITLFINRDHSEVDPQPDITVESPTNIDMDTSTNTSTTEKVTDEPEIIQEESAYDITSTDCDSKCVDINNKSKKEYCNQICGLSPTTQTGSCDDLSTLDKDYCLKDKAISEKDINICSQISDSGIKKQCQNRVNEDFMDEVM